MWNTILSKRILVVFLFALCSHFAFFWLFAGHTYTELEATDGSQYMALMNNVLAGRGFSLRLEAPYVLDTIRTPVYPYVLAFFTRIFGTIYPTIYLSLFLVATIPLAGMGIMRKLKASPRLELATGLFLALDPHLWYYGMIYGSESVFLPLIAWGMYFVVSVFHEPTRVGRACFAGFVVGVATLARPIVQFVPFVLCAIVAVQYIRNKIETRSLAKATICFTLAWGVTVAPWLFRNHAAFGTWDFSNVGWFNMYTRVAATAEAIETKRPYDTMRIEYLQRLHDKGYVIQSPVEEQDVHGYSFKPIFQKETIAEIARFPKGFVISQISSFFTVVSQDLTIIYGKKLGLLDFTYPSFSPVVALTTQGPVQAMRLFMQEFSWAFVFAALARVGWIVIFSISLLAPWFAWRFRRDIFPVTMLLVLYDLGIIALSLNAAAQTDARYRAQFIFVQIPLFFLTYALWKYRGEKNIHEQMDNVPKLGPLCPICESKSLSVVRGYVRGFAISKCALCGTHATSPTPSADDMKKIYGEGYFNGKGEFGYANYDADKLAASESFDGFLDLIEKYGLTKGNLLDIGAATGVFMQSAAKRQWKVTGHELSETAAIKARQKGLDVRIGLLNSAHESASYQAITLLDVVEHVPHPQQLVTDAAEKLASGGVMLINTPDAGSAYARILGLHWHAFVPPEHLTLLTSQAARLLLERCGLDVVWVGRVRKAFRLSYILRIASHWLKWKKLATCGIWLDAHPRLNVSVPLDLRDNMVLVARKP